MATAEISSFAPNKRFRIGWQRVMLAATMALGALTAALGAAVLAGFVSAWGGIVLRPTHGIDIVVVGYLVATGPWAFVEWRRSVRIQRIDERLPDFLTDVASLHKAGLTLQDSLLSAAEGNYGPLNQEIRMTADHVRWNVPILLALENLMHRIGTPMAQRTMTVVLEAGHSGGNVPEVLEIAAGNARAFIALRDERKRSMGIYTIITYVASLVFVGVVLALQGVFVPKMVSAFGNVGQGGAAVGFSVLPSPDSFRNLFYASAVVQSVGNGLVGGVMTDGHPLTGLRHGWIMVAFCFVGFLVAG